MKKSFVFAFSRNYILISTFFLFLFTQLRFLPVICLHMYFVKCNIFKIEITVNFQHVLHLLY